MPKQHFPRSKTQSNRTLQLSKRFNKGAPKVQSQADERHKAKHPFTAPKKSMVFVNKQNDGSSNRKTFNYNKNNNQMQKPKAPLSKKELRERKRERKQKKSHGKLRTELNYSLSSSGNEQSWKKRKIKDRHAIIGKLLEQMKGHILDIVKALDSTKLIQTAIKYGSQPQILQITKELKGHFIDLSGDHYSWYTVYALLQYGRVDVRAIIISELSLAVTRLILHRKAGSVVDYAIMTIATERQRRRAFQFFISKKFILTTPTENEDDANALPKSVEQIFADCEDTIERNHMLNTMGKFLISGFEKEIQSTGIFQTIMYYYLHFTRLNGNINHNRKLESMIELMLPHVLEVQNVLQGAMSVIEAVNACYFIKPKLRKNLLKSLHPTVIPMCCDKFSYLVILRCLDVIDDTVILNKLFLKQIASNLHILMFHDFGRLILLHLLCPRDEKVFGRNKLYQKLLKKPVTKLEYERELKEADLGSFMDDSDDDEEGSDNDDDDDAKMQEKSVKSDNKRKLDMEMPSCKKSPELKRIRLLLHVLPAMVVFCEKNIKKVLTHPLAGTVLIALMRHLAVQMKSDSDGLLKGYFERLCVCVVQNSIHDSSPREMSPTPELPEQPTNIEEDIQMNNIVDDSLKLVHSKEEEDKKEKSGNNGISLNTIDMSGLDPKTAKNILMLKHHQMSSKNNAEFIKLNAQYEVEMLNYKLIGNRHKKQIKKEDLENGIMEHNIGHRRLRKMIEEFGDDVHGYFMQVLMNGKIVNDDKWMRFLSIKGVYVIWELYNCGNQEIKEQLKAKLLEICNEKNIQSIITKHKNFKFDGLAKLCKAIGVAIVIP